MRVANFSALTVRPGMEFCALPDPNTNSTQVTQHRLELNPAYTASWYTKPRVHFDATLVRVTTDTGLVGYGSGDLMVGFKGHESLFIGQDPLAVERHHRALSHIDLHSGR